MRKKTKWSVVEVPEERVLGKYRNKKKIMFTCFAYAAWSSISMSSDVIVGGVSGIFEEAGGCGVLFEIRLEGNGE